jgi:hypothetical protein
MKAAADIAMMIVFTLCSFVAQEPRNGARLVRFPWLVASRHGEVEALDAPERGGGLEG